MASATEKLFRLSLLKQLVCLLVNSAQHCVTRPAGVERAEVTARLTSSPPLPGFCEMSQVRKQHVSNDPKPRARCASVTPGHPRTSCVS